MSRDRWQARYSQPDRVWSAEPNPWLVQIVSDIPVGAAADLGCGEGADALYLAALGWQVQAIDFAPAALARGSAQADAQRLSGRVTWVEQDLGKWVPEPRAFDLVSVQFFHTEPDLRRRVHAAAWAATRGFLLIVGHDRSNATEGHGGPPDPTVLYTADEVLADLNLGEDGHGDATVEICERRERHRPDTGHSMLDSVVLIQRT